MKTTITAPDDDRKAFHTANGLRTVDAGASVTVGGLQITQETRERLERAGWSFEDEGAPVGDLSGAEGDVGNADITEASEDDPAPVKPAPKRGRKG